MDMIWADLSENFKNARLTSDQDQVAEVNTPVVLSGFPSSVWQMKNKTLENEMEYMLKLLNVKRGSVNCNE